MSSNGFYCTWKSVAGHGDHYLASSRLDIALDVKDLLPRAEHKARVAHGHGHLGSEKCRLQVGMAVAVVPGLFVRIVAARRKEAVQYARQILDETGFVLDRPYACGASDVEHVRNAMADAGPRHDVLDRGGEVVHLARARRAQRDNVLQRHVFLTCRPWIQWGHAIMFLGRIPRPA